MGKAGGAEIEKSAGKIKFSKGCPLFRFSRHYNNEEVSVCLTLTMKETARVTF